jgi:hypothetical protein
MNKVVRASLYVVLTILVVTLITTVVLTVYTSIDSMHLQNAVTQAVGVQAQRPPPYTLDVQRLATDTQMTHGKTSSHLQLAAELLMFYGQSNVLPNDVVQLQLLSSSTGFDSVWILDMSTLDELWVVFRGTQTVEEWEQNFQLKQIHVYTKATGLAITALPNIITDSTENLDDQMKVHSGFLNMYMQLHDEVSSYTQKRSKLVLCGHSMGAALAQLCALYATGQQQQQPVYLFTFGSPRVGNKAFVQALVSNPRLEHFTNVVNREDIVCDFPFSVQPILSPPYMPALFARTPDEHTLAISVNEGSWYGNHDMVLYTNELLKLV